MTRDLNATWLLVLGICCSLAVATLLVRCGVWP
jgi:hypothetical protein